MTAPIRRIWRKTSPFARVFPIVLMALGAGAVPALAADADNDGMDDAYEAFFGLNVAINDAALDPDGDGLSNLAESGLWTDPFAADTDRDGFLDNADSNAVSRAWVPWGGPRFTAGNDVAYVWPAWMIAVFRSGGDWRTNPAAWHVAADETNGAALNLEVDRQMLTNDLALRMGYIDHSNATLYVELYDTNNAVVASNLFDNILSGSGADTNRVLSIPLESHANAVGIRLRRGSGEATVFDTLLYVDRDGDGLDADQERQLGTSDNDADSDHDGFTDFEEAFLFGTDPASAASVPFGSLLGQVAYSGVMTGTIHMVAAPASGAWTSAWSSVLSAPGAYALDAPRRQTYYVKAYRDVNGNGVKDYWEPCGTALPLSVYLETAATNEVDVALGDPDSDGDGMSDAVELALGLDPFVPTAFARLPFVENFETNTVQVGEVDGQNGWQAGPSGLALVQTGLVWEGSQALRINSYGAFAKVRQLFAATNAPVVWADARAMAWAGGAPTNPVWGSANAYLDDDGYLRVYDGLAASTNKWLVLTNLPPRAMTGEWVRLTVKLDYATQRWLACLDGVLARGNLGFATPVAQFNVMSVEGKRAAVDAICVGTNQPAGLSLDGDNLPDDWELAHFGNLDQVDDGDPDNDKLTNLQEYRLGTDPLVADADTDNDGMPDALELALGTNPLVPDADADPDNDGLTNLQESQLGTNPLNPDTDGDGMPDGWEVANGLNSLFNDAAKDPDHDGLPNLQEYLHGTDPHNPDTDGDELTDGDEVTNRLTSPTKSDTDGDGMPDKWELDNGMNPFVNDAAQDPDVDRVSNLQEFLHGADPHNADTDGDGMDDGWEVYAHTDPKTADGSGWGTLLNSITVNPVDTNAVIGRWETVDGNALKALDYSGSAGYNFDVSTQAVYVLEVAGVQMVTNARWPNLRVLARVDGENVGQQEISATVRNGKVYFISPLLTNGTHSLWLDWDNVYDDSQLKITGIRLLNYSGSDNNTNGTPDWVENRLSSTCTWDPVRSLKVSPVCIEGNGLFLSKMKLAGTDAVLKHGAGDRWYANVPLSATNATEVQVSVEDGERVISRSLVWEQTDVLSSSNLMIRKGDALLLAAAPTGSLSGTVTINIPGLTNCVTTVDAPVMARFNSNGTFTVTGSFNDGATNLSKSISIQVIAASFPTNLSAVLLNKTRDMINPGIPCSNVVVQGDSSTVLGQSVAYGTGSRYTASLTEVDSEHYLVARLGNDGPVLDSTRLLGTWVREATTGFQLVDTLSDGSKVWQTTIRTGYFPADGQIQVQIFAAGAMFEDGSHLLTMTAANLDDLGGTNYRIVVPPGSHICHHVNFVQNGASMVIK